MVASYVGTIICHTYQPQYGTKPGEEDEVKGAFGKQRGDNRFFEGSFSVGFRSPLLSGQRQIICFHAAVQRCRSTPQRWSYSAFRTNKQNASGVLADVVAASAWY